MMWTGLKAAWMTLGAFKHAKVYLLAALLAVGIWALFVLQQNKIDRQARIIQSAGETLGQSQQTNKLLRQQLASARSDRTDVENKLSALNAAQASNAEHLNEVKRENEQLRQRMYEAQKNAPGADSRLSGDVKRMHEQAIREFNERYGRGAGNSQAGDPASADVRAAGWPA
ncbi:hypothetical protein C1Y41_19575 [Pantoea sp. ICBG 1758]|uniref:hypothetical protein n=1 Tax=Pantoea sp. ICBG 1758 TaxID=2071682 RepID=UPI000CE5247F|nr:hypothetical protein [Pantoea sp. ICBG 1758]PPC61167.1 hypothetical protein C1Y41_19575 [Pantoea sp. ICBG 1758]